MWPDKRQKKEKKREGKRKRESGKCRSPALVSTQEKDQNHSAHVLKSNQPSGLHSGGGGREKETDTSSSSAEAQGLSVANQSGEEKKTFGAIPPQGNSINLRVKEKRQCRSYRGGGGESIGYSFSKLGGKLVLKIKRKA